MISSVATLSPSGLRFFHRSCTAFGIHTIPLSTVWVSYFLTVQTLGFTQLECPLLGVHFSHCSGKRTITPYKKTNTQLKNDYPDKRTISKHKATARRPFGGRKSVGRNNSLVVFLSKKFRKHRHNPKNWQKERTQSSIRFVSMIASLFGAGDRARTGTLLPARDFKSLVSAIPPHRPGLPDYSTTNSAHRQDATVRQKNPPKAGAFGGSVFWRVVTLSDSGAALRRPARALRFPAGRACCRCR